MPTAAKLFSAFYFAALAYVAAGVFQQATAEGVFVPELQPSEPFGIFAYLSAAIGALSGWFAVGQVAGKPYQGAGLKRTLGWGMRTGATLVFFVIVVLATYEMVLEALKMRYHGPVDAVLGMVKISVTYAKFLLYPPLAGVLIAGSFIGGLLAEGVGRRWP